MSLFIVYIFIDSYYVQGSALDAKENTEIIVAFLPYDDCALEGAMKHLCRWP